MCASPTVRQSVTENVSPIIKSREYALPSDLQARQMIESIPVLPRAVEWVINNWNTPFVRAQLLGNGVHVSPDQLQSVYSLACLGASRLGIPVPDIFVKQDPTFNAYTLGTNSDPVIVIHSALLDELEQDELLFVIGHEMGHIHCHHVVYGTIARIIATGLGTLAASLFHPLSSAISAWQRQGELTADRAGAIICQDPEASLRAIVMMAVGSRKLLSEMNLASYLRQSLDNKNAYARFDTVFWARSHPYLSTRAEQLVRFLRSPIGQDLIGTLEPQHARMLPDTAIPQSSSAHPDAELRTISNAYPIFCPTCGFEAIEANGKTICPICGVQVEP